MTDRTCTVDGCDRRWASRKLCPMHYQKLSRLGALPAIQPRPDVCAAEGCERAVRANGWCNMHYQRLKDKNSLEGRQSRFCEVDDCQRRHNSNGMCLMHQRRFWRHGTPTPARKLPRKISSAIYSAQRRERLAAATVEQFTRQEIFERDGWVCGICRTPIDVELSWPNVWSASLDHIVPLIHDGEHSRANTQAAHLRCNIRKRDRLLLT